LSKQGVLDDNKLKVKNLGRKMLSLQETEEMRDSIISKKLGRAITENDLSILKELDFRTLRGLLGSDD